MRLNAAFLAFAFLASGYAQAAPAVEPVKVNLQAFKVVSANGKESLVESKTAKPGDVLEYRATYTNTGKKAVTNLAATLPVPQGMEYVALSSQPSSALASVDGQNFSAVPLMRRQADGKEQPVPAAEYRALRWKVADLQPGKSFVVSARVRVAAGEAARNN